MESFDLREKTETIQSGILVGIGLVQHGRVLLSARRLLGAILGALALLGLIAGIQLSSGAYHSDFDADYDEASHAVSSLLVHDYLVHGLPTNPVAFAENYYVHYPKVAIGHWPPLFYGSEALWMLAFGRTRAAMLSIEAFFAFLLLAGVLLWTARDFGVWAGTAAAVVLLVPQFMQIALFSVAPNMMLALCSFAAAAAYGAYQQRRSIQSAILFAVLACVCMGIHGRGVAVALIPLLAPLLRGRVGLSRWRILAGIVAIGAMLWIPMRLGQAGKTTFGSIADLARAYADRTVVQLTLLVILTAIVGAIRVMRDPDLQSRWLGMAALPLCAWIFHALVNVGMGDRYLITAVPAIAALFGAGVHQLGSTFRSGSRAIRIGLAAAGVLMCANVAFMALPLQKKPDLGYHRLVNEGAAALGDSPVYLIAGDPLHEGGLISEIDLRDPLPKHFVLRGSKMLASSSWVGKGYKTRFQNAAEVSDFLNTEGVGTVLIQQPYNLLHAHQLLEAVTQNSANWREEYPPERPAAIRIFRRLGPTPAVPPKITIDLRNRIGRTVEAH